MEEEIKILRELQNSVGHALLDYYYSDSPDRTSNIQARRRAMETIQIASNKCDVLLKNLSSKQRKNGEKDV